MKVCIPGKDVIVVNFPIYSRSIADEILAFVFSCFLFSRFFSFVTLRIYGISALGRSPLKYCRAMLHTLCSFNKKSR